MNTVGGDIDVAEEIFLHEVVIGRCVRRIEAYVFVEIECRDSRKIETLFAMHSGQLAVKTARRSACGQAQYRGWFFANLPGDKSSGYGTRFFRCG